MERFIKRTKPPPPTFHLLLTKDCDVQLVTKVVEEYSVGMVECKVGIAGSTVEKNYMSNHQKVNY